jgi:hypothetical protein
MPLALIVLALVLVFVAFLVASNFLLSRGRSWTIVDGRPGDALIERAKLRSPVNAGTPAVLSMTVTPEGGAPYQAEVDHLIPRDVADRLVPGTRISVLIDPADPQRVLPNLGSLNLRPSDAEVAVATALTSITITPVQAEAAGSSSWDPTAVASGKIKAITAPPAGGEMADLARERPMTLLRQSVSLGWILRATRTSTKVSDLDPQADPARASDSIWLLKVQPGGMRGPGQPHVIAQWVPRDLEAGLGPATLVHLHTDPANPAASPVIDWRFGIQGVWGQPRQMGAPVPPA